MLRHCFAAVPHRNATLLLEAQPSSAQFEGHSLFIDSFDKAWTKLAVHGQTGTNDFCHDPLDLRVKDWMGPFLALLVIFVVHTFLFVP